MSKRVEQKEHRRMEIIKAGLHLFIRKGIGAVKITDIAEQAGMSLGLLYHYFGSVEALYEELITLGVSGRRGQLMSAYDNTAPLDFFTKSAAHIFETIKKEPFVAEMFVLMHQAQKNPDTAEKVKSKIGKDDIISTSISLIKAGQEQGVIRGGNPAALALAFWLAVQGYVEMIALNPDTPYPQSEWFVDILR